MTKKIVFFSTPAYGHLVPEFPVIKKLIDKGYLIDWYCSKKYEDFVKKSGANFIAYDVDFDAKYNVAEMTQDFYHLLKYSMEINRENYFINLEKIDDDTELILYDSMVSFAKNIAKKKNIKSICFCATIAYNRYVVTFSNMFLPCIKLFLKHGLSVFKMIKEEIQFRKINGMVQFNLLDMFVNKGDVTIVFTPRELQPFGSSFANEFKFIGTTIKNRLPFKEEDYNENYDVYVSFGSVFTDNREVINKIISDEYFNAKKVIINIGDNPIESNKSNIKFVHYTNQMELLKHCKVFINQGGLNSIYEGINAKVMQICIPQQEEERMNAKIIAKRGLGFCLRKFDLKKVKKLIKKIEENEKYQENLEKYRALLQQYDGTKIALEHIVKLLEE